MRYITCPEDVDIYNEATDERWTDEKGKPMTIGFKTFFFGRIQDAYGDDAESVSLSRKLIKKAKAIKPGHILELSEEEHQKILEKTKTPGSKYVPLIAAQLETFFNAIYLQSEENPLGATGTRPSPQEVKEKECVAG